MDETFTDDELRLIELIAQISLEEGLEDEEADMENLDQRITEFFISVGVHSEAGERAYFASIGAKAKRLRMSHIESVWT